MDLPHNSTVLSTTFNLYNRKTYARSRGNQCNINGTPDYGGFPQFLFEPTCLYLEDQGSEKSCSFDVAKLFFILPPAIREGVKVRVRKCILELYALMSVTQDDFFRDYKNLTGQVLLRLIHLYL